MKVIWFATTNTKFNLALITALCILIPMTANADWTVNTEGGVSIGDPQDIVVTLNSNPRTNPEAACLAVTFARMSKMGGANVTLFPTLEGVALGDKKVVSSQRHRQFKCSVSTMMDADGEISLEENLNMFLADSQNDMVICPLCWVERYGDAPPEYGFLPPECEFDVNNNVLNPECMAVMKMTLDADKVFDF